MTTGQAVGAGAGLTSELVEVTPARAQEWLNNMASNRRVSKGNLDGIVRAMENGHWHDDGTPIRFNREGKLIDGQHRLQAVVLTGKKRDFFVIRGVDDSAMATLDTGKSRSKGDVLMIHDPSISDVNSLAAATTICLRWTRGVRGHPLRNAVMSNDDVLAFFDENKESLIAATHAGRRMARVASGSGQAFAMCFWLFNDLDEGDAEFFWDRLVDGAGLKVGDPIYALRELLARQSRMAKTREKLRPDILAALTIKAWNAFREGREIKALGFRVGGAMPEQYPEPI